MHYFVKVSLKTSIFADSELNIYYSVVEIYLEAKVFVDFDGSQRKISLVNDHFVLNFDVKSEVLVEDSDDVMNSKAVENDNRFKHLLHISLLFWLLWQRSQQLFVKVAILSSS